MQRVREHEKAKQILESLEEDDCFVGLTIMPVYSDLQKQIQMNVEQRLHKDNVTNTLWSREVQRVESGDDEDKKQLMDREYFFKYPRRYSYSTEVIPEEVVSPPFKQFIDHVFSLFDQEVLEQFKQQEDLSESDSS